MRDAGATAPKTFLLKRGELKHPGAEVLPGWLLVLSPEQKEKPATVQPLPARLIVFWFIGGLLEAAVTGAIAGALFKPAVAATAATTQS